MSASKPNLTVTQKIVHAWGKVRRFYYGIFCQDYIERSHARRRGRCARCGACCRLMFDCPQLVHTNGSTLCKKHRVKYKNCRIFPVDEADLAERNILSPETKCGYSFAPRREA